MIFALLFATCYAAVDQAALDALPDAPVPTPFPSGVIVFGTDSDRGCLTPLRWYAFENAANFCSSVYLEDSVPTAAQAVRSWGVDRAPGKPNDPYAYLTIRCKVLKPFNHCDKDFLQEGLLGHFTMCCEPPGTVPKFTNWETDDERRATCVPPEDLVEKLETIGVVVKPPFTLRKVANIAGKLLCRDGSS